MTNKEKIKTEVPQLKNSIEIGLCTYDIGVENGAFEAYKEKSLKIIDSLPKESASEDLEKEIESLWNKWTTGETPMYNEPNPNAWLCINKNNFKFIAKHFATWKEERMMKDTFDAKVEWYDGLLLNYTQEAQDTALEKIGAKIGDNVKVIVVKED